MRAHRALDASDDAPLLRSLSESMRYVFFIFITVMSASSYCQITQDPADMRNAENALLACEGLGELCEKEKEGCSPDSSPMINTCLAIRYFRLEVAKERCGNDQFLQCDMRNSEYALKWMRELSLPNLNNPKRDFVSRECQSAGDYVVKSETLNRFAESVYEVFNHIRDPIEVAGGHYYRDEEQYFRCFADKLK